MPLLASPAPHAQPGSPLVLVTLNSLVFSFQSTSTSRKRMGRGKMRVFGWAVFQDTVMVIAVMRQSCRVSCKHGGWPQTADAMSRSAELLQEGQHCVTRTLPSQRFLISCRQLLGCSVTLWMLFLASKQGICWCFWTPLCCPDDASRSLQRHQDNAEFHQTHVVLLA